MPRPGSSMTFVLPEANTLYFAFLESFPRSQDMECAVSADNSTFVAHVGRREDWEVSGEDEVFTTRELFKHVCELKPLDFVVVSHGKDPYKVKKERATSDGCDDCPMPEGRFAQREPSGLPKPHQDGAVWGAICVGFGRLPPPLLLEVRRRFSNLQTLSSAPPAP